MSIKNINSFYKKWLCKYHTVCSKVPKESVLSREKRSGRENESRNAEHIQNQLKEEKSANI